MIDGLPVLMLLAFILIGAAVSGLAVMGSVVFVLLKLFGRRKRSRRCVRCIAPHGCKRFGRPLCWSWP